MKLLELLEKIKKSGSAEQYAKCGKAVLAYSGGLDTSVILKLLVQMGVEVVAYTADLGSSEYNAQNMQQAKQKALDLGASKAIMGDLKNEFVKGFVNKAIQANCLYEGIYPCSTALARPLIAEKLVQVAKQENAAAIVHGCTGKGNDYLRFHVSVKALNPQLEVLAPVRDWQLTRNEEIGYAEAAGVPVPTTKKSPYSVDANLWGRSSEGGEIEFEDQEVPEQALEWVTPPQKALDTPASVKIHFEQGIPTKAEFNGKTFQDEAEMIGELNAFAGAHGVGTIDLVEDRTIGLKGREHYECPAATVILKAHKDLELLCLPKELNSLKPFIDQKFAEYCYTGLWHSPGMHAVNAFTQATQANVNGWVQVKLFKGSAMVIARSSPNGLYSRSLATYGKSEFDQLDSKGFANLYALSTITAAKAATLAKTAETKVSEK